jgi:hypothetical protein
MRSNRVDTGHPIDQANDLRRNRLHENIDCFLRLATPFTRRYFNAQRSVYRNGSLVALSPQIRVGRFSENTFIDVPER